MQKAFRFITILMLLISQSTLAAMPLCASIHVPPQGIFQRLEITEDSSFQASELRLIRKDFEASATGLADLVSMAGQTTAIRLDEKNFNKKSEFTLGLLLKDGYSLEFRYEADSRIGKDNFKLQNVEIVSPTLFRKDITKTALNRHALDFHADGIHTLNDLFPSGYRITAQIPMIIDGKLLSEFQSILPRLGNFSKDEIRRMTATGEVKKLKMMGHFRALKIFVKETLAKMTFKEAVRMAFFVAVMSQINGGSPVKSPEPQVMTPVTHQWISDMSLSLGLALGKDIKQEALMLNQEILKQSKGQHQSIGIDVNQTKLQIGLVDYVWLVEKADTQKTYLSFSRDMKNGNLEYFLIEIDPKLYPKTIAALKDSNAQMKLN